MRSRPLDRDKLFLFDRANALSLAVRALHPVQNEDPEAIVAGASVLFAAICHRLRLDPEEAHKLGMKMLRAQPQHDKHNKLAQSLLDFAGLRIAGQEVVAS